MDENNIAPDIVLGGNVYLYMDWIGLFICSFLTAIAFINIFKIPSKFSKAINLLIFILSSIVCFIAFILLLNSITYLSKINMPIYSINGRIMAFIMSLMVIIFPLATAGISLWSLIKKEHS